MGKTGVGQVGADRFLLVTWAPAQLEFYQRATLGEVEVYACMHACVCVHLGVNRDLSHKADLVGSPADFSKE